MPKQKWLIPYRRYKLNYEDVGFLPLVLQHDIGFSGEKTYHVVRQRGHGQFYHVPESSLHYKRLEALAEIKRLAKQAVAENPIPRSWTPARVRRLKSGQVQVAVGGRGKR